MEFLKLRKEVYEVLGRRVLRLPYHVTRECVHLSEMGCDSGHLSWNNNAEGDCNISYERAQSWLAIEDIE
jgi:hypothetical protein